MSEWVLNQSWGLPVLAAFLAVVLVFEARKAIKAYKEKKDSSSAWRCSLRSLQFSHCSCCCIIKRAASVRNSR